MIPEKRIPKENDKENSLKAEEILFEMMNMNPGIEAAVFVNGMFRAIAQLYKRSGYPYEVYELDMNNAKKVYKSFWKKE